MTAATATAGRRGAAAPEGGEGAEGPGLHGPCRGGSVEGKNIGASEPPSGGRFIFIFYIFIIYIFCFCFFVCLFFIVFILLLGFGVLLCFLLFFWCFLVFLILFLDSSRFSASIAFIFVENIDSGRFLGRFIFSRILYFGVHQYFFLQQ